MKAIAIISQHPTLKTLVDENNKALDDFQTRSKAMFDELDVWKKDFWGRFEAELKALGLIEEVDKLNISIQAKKDIILAGPREDELDEEKKKIIEILKNLST